MYFSTRLNVSHVHAMRPPIWLKLGCWMSSKKIKYIRCSLIANLFHLQWPNSTPNRSNWLVTRSPDAHVIKLNTYMPNKNTGKIIISSCFESKLSSYRPTLKKQNKLAHSKTIEHVYIEVEWFCIRWTNFSAQSRPESA